MQEREFKADLFDVVEFIHDESKYVAYEKYSYWRSTFRTFFKSKFNIFLITAVTVLVLMAFLYPVFYSSDPYSANTDFYQWNQAPGDGHLFGTDSLGRDIFARTWYGTRTSLLLAFIIAFCDVTIGVFAGAIWGYVKKVDRPMTELYNIVMNVPQTVYLIILSYILRPGFWTIVIAKASRGWLSIGKFIRNKVLVIRDSEYNIASTCLGTPLRRVVIKNIIPFLVSIIIMETALSIPYVIGSEVFLGFIGLGMPTTSVSLGVLVNEGKNSFQNYPYQLIYPTSIVAFITVSFYIIGNRFADSSDPKNHI